MHTPTAWDATLFSHACLDLCGIKELDIVLIIGEETLELDEIFLSGSPMSTDVSLAGVMGTCERVLA